MDTLDRIGLGTMGIDEPATIALAAETGYRHFDTAQVYDNESVVGDGLAHTELDRDEVFIATKLWIDQLEYDSVERSTTESLERLKLNYLDLLYIHRPRGAYDPKATLGAFEELVEENLINHIGVSNFEVSQIQEARDYLDTPIFANQVEYHPLFQPEAALADAQEHDYYLIAYSPLANGRASEIPEVVDIANDRGATPEAICIAWLTEKDNVIVLPKASSEKHLRANRNAATLTLNTDERARINGITRENELFPE